MLKLTTVTLFATVTLATLACNRDPYARAPRLILVVPDREEDLRFLNPADAGVDLLSGKIVFSIRGADLQPRRSAFYLPQGKPFLIAAFDVESLSYMPTEQQIHEAARLIANRTAEHFFAAVQVNFQPLPKQRGWFRDFLSRLRPLLRNHQLLVAAVDRETCSDRDWAQSLAVDALVPLERVCGDTYRLRIAPGHDLAIRSSMKRIYLESTTPWTAASVAEIAGLINSR